MITIYGNGVTKCVSHYETITPIINSIVISWVGSWVRQWLYDPPQRLKSCCSTEEKFKLSYLE